MEMFFNPDLSKQDQEVIFSRKASRVDHPVVTFNNSSLTFNNSLPETFRFILR